MDSNRHRLRRPEAGSYLNEKHGFGSARLLAEKATKGGGPKYARVGRFVVYEIADLDAWAEAQLSPKVSSTSEYTPVGGFKRGQRGPRAKKPEPTP